MSLSTTPPSWKVGFWTVFGLAAIGLLFTCRSLSVLPFETGVRWNRPTLLAANDRGEMAVINRSWRQLVLLDRDGRVRGVVNEGVNENQFRRSAGLAMSDDAVYVADGLAAQNGTSVRGVRIVKYNLDGTYAGVVYREDFSKACLGDKALQELCCHQGRLYAFTAKDNEGRLLEFADGTAKTVLSRKLRRSRMQFVQYLPRTNEIITSLASGETTSASLDDPDANPTRRSEMDYLQHVVCGPNGNWYWADRLKGVISVRTPDGESHQLAKAWADRLQVVGDRLFFVDHRRNPLRFYSLTDGTITDCDMASYAPEVLWRSRLAWTCAAVLALLTLVLLAGLAAAAVRRRRTKAASPADGETPMGMGALYGRNLLLTLIIFLVVTSTLSVGYYKDLLKSGQNDAMKAAAMLRDLSAGKIGDKLVEKDGSVSFEGLQTLDQLMRTVCTQGSEVGTDLDCIIARCEPSGTFRCLLTLMHHFIAAGDDLNEIAESHFHLKEIKARAHEGLITTYRLAGYDILAVPIADSKGTVQAFAYLMKDGALVMQLLRKHVFELSIDLLSQLLVLVMIFGECQLMMLFLRRRRELHAADRPPVTMVEVHHPILILQFVISSSFLAFLPELSASSAAKLGLSGEVMTTLPLIALQLVYYVGRMVLQDLCSRSPRRTLWSGCLGMLVFAALMFLFIRNGNYWVLVAAVSVQSAAAAVIDCASLSLRGCGLEPDRRFRLLVFTNMEPAIGCGIGVALGAFLYAKLGLAWVTGATVLMTAGIAALAFAFVHRDIDADALSSKRADGGAPAARASLGETLRFCLDPLILAIVLCITMPIGIISSFENYALPVFNEESGNSVVLVGFVLVIAKLVTLFVLPGVFRWTDRSGNVSGMSLATTAMLGMVLLFALSPTMLLMVCVVFLFGIVDAVVATCAERLEVEESERRGVPYDSAAKFLVVGEAVSYSIGAPVFCWLIAGGYGRLGFSVFFTGMALLAVFLLVANRRRRPAETPARN